MSYPCETTNLPALPTLSVRKRTPAKDLQSLMAKYYPEIAHYLTELGEAPAGAPFAAYYNMDMADLDVEVGIPVSSPIPPKGEINSGHFPGGRYAVCHYTGPYEQMASAYDQLTAYLQTQGLQPTGTAYEFYLDDPGTTPPEKLRTDILFTLED